MIAILSGLPGSGKTLSAIKRFLLPAVKQGRKIYANIEGLDLLRLSIFVGVDYEKVEKQVIAHENYNEKDKELFKFSTSRVSRLFDECEKDKAGCLMIIDEAQIFWNNRAYASKENIDLLPLLQKHRHYGIDLVFLTQNIDQLDIGIRRLAQVHYRLRRLSNVGLNKVVKVDIYPDAMGSEQFKPMATNAWTIDKAIFKFYSSYLAANITEAKRPVRNIILKNPRIIFALVVVVLCSIFAWNLFTKTGRQMFAPKMLQKDFSKFSLGDYEEYYCGEKFYVLRATGKVDTIQPAEVPPSFCPHINFNFRRPAK